MKSTVLATALLMVCLGACADDGPWLTLQIRPGELATPEPTPQLRIFGDGTVQVYRAAYLKQPGLYEYRLSADEHSKLVAMATDPALLSIDSDAMNQALKASAKRLAAGGGHRYVSDPNVYTLQVSPDDIGRGATGEDEPATLTWNQLHPDLIKAGDVPERRQLEDLSLVLHELTQIDTAERNVKRIN